MKGKSQNRGQEIDFQSHQTNTNIDIVITRQYHLETLISGWLITSITIIVAAVLVHINLNFIIGSCIIFIGLLLTLITLIGAIIWFLYGENNVSEYLKIRKVILIFKFLLIMVIMGLFVWVAVLMIIRTIEFR